MRRRSLLLGILVVGAVACGQVGSLFEPSPTQLLTKANSNLQTAKTAHIDGTGSFALKGGFSVTFDFKLSGDLELPDKSRMSADTALLGQSFSVQTITVDGKTYTKQSTNPSWVVSTPSSKDIGSFDPFGKMDLSNVLSVTEVDRPEVDGRKTRHLAYTVDAKAIVDRLQQGAGSLGATNAAAGGEVWIRLDDTQIVRQIVKVSFDIDASQSLLPGLPAATGASAAKGSFEMSFDLRLSDIGEPVSPPITAPAVK